MSSDGEDASTAAKRASVVHCTIAILIYFLIAGTIIRLSISEDFGNDITGEVRTGWPMRVLAALINAAASIIYCADPLFILSNYCTKYCTESQQDKLNIYAWIGVIGMMGGAFVHSLIRDYLVCKRVFRSSIQRFIHGLRSTVYLWYDIYNTCTNNFVNFVENDYD